MKEEIKPILEILAAIILGIITLPLGIVWNFFKPFYDYRTHRFKDTLKQFGLYWLKLFYQIWNVIKFFLHNAAVGIDLLGNVVIGDLIEDIVTHKEKTWFGNGKVTISAAIGQLEHYNNLNKRGKWLSKMLSIVFEPNHCKNAYEKERLEIKRMEEFRDENNN